MELKGVMGELKDDTHFAKKEWVSKTNVFNSL